MLGPSVTFSRFSLIRIFIVAFLPQWQIVLISGLENKALEEACEQGRNLGLRVTGILRKPINADSLKALLADLEY